MRQRRGGHQKPGSPERRVHHDKFTPVMSVAEQLRNYSGSRSTFSGMKGKMLAGEVTLQREEPSVPLLAGCREITSDAAEPVVFYLRLILSSPR
jgi:hypothetical protein